MPILQSKNQATRNSDNFQKLICKVIKRCWSILLRPIMKLDELELNIKNVQITFTPRISVFLADMLEANAITCTYKSANCKMPCPSCIVHIEDLNNMKISKGNITLRTPNSMASVIISIVDGLFDDNDSRIIERRSKNKNPYISSTRLTSVYFFFVHMYIMSRNEEFSEEDLIKFEVRQKALIESTTKSVKQKVGQLSSKLYDIRFSAFENHLEIFQQLEILNPLQLEGMENLLDSLNKLKDDILLDKVDSFIRLYKKALNNKSLNTSIDYATSINEFHYDILGV
ncbi:22911_t:CDS:2 [Rhizophagus irregularis]|nr:22911_t:CDS:2 [Rhizophagus irregularis]